MVIRVDNFLKYSVNSLKLQQLFFTGELTSNKGVDELSHKVSKSCLTICRRVVSKMCRRIVLSTSCLVPAPLTSVQT